MVEDAAPLKEVMEDFHKWLLSQHLLNKEFAVVTCGDWDLKELLPRQFLHTGQVVPAYFKSWINIKMVRNKKTQKTFL
jgi:inhibitor of KinA sporulation pathway (predicted exonuclease)